MVPRFARSVRAALSRTVLGIALRAASDNFRMTRMLGVPANLVISARVLDQRTSCRSRGTVLGRPNRIGDSGHRPRPLLVAFVATVIGGINSLLGAVVGGYVYGIVFSFIGVLLPQGMLEFREAFMFIIVILILLFRPEGLIRGAYSTKRVG